MPRFYFDPADVKDGVVVLNKRESRHAAVVLRLKNGDAVELLDGSGNSFSGVVIGKRDGCLAVMKCENRGNIPAFDVETTLGISVIRPERMEFLIQKACELGVSTIAPLLTERSIVKLSKQRWDAKIERWHKIVRESCKQCGLTIVPKIRSAEKYENFLNGAVSSYDKVLIPTLCVENQALFQAFSGPRPKKVLCLIGPEGDFTKKEVEMALSFGALPVSLGPLVLRSETAAIYLLSALNFFYREIEHEKRS
jgi:16S rRNA (uracil1498-N3)-methyltransferase